MLGEITQLDRRFPLVRCEDGQEFRCEEAASVKKQSSVRSVIGDHVEVTPPGDHDFGIIESILPRSTSLVRKDPADKSASQVLAANFSQVVIIEPFDRLNTKRIERELVLAHETGAKVAVLLTKSDTVSQEDGKAMVADIEDLAGPNVRVFSTSIEDASSIPTLKNELFIGETSILLGQSGAGKSTLINTLLGENLQATGDVRAADGKGRHTTVNRAIIDLGAQEGGAGRIVDMPGIKGLGLWDADSGIEGAFEDIVELAQNCRFRDCTHNNEPGCAVKGAVENGKLSSSRLQSYLELKTEVEAMRKRREQATWKNK